MSNPPQDLMAALKESLMPKWRTIRAEDGTEKSHRSDPATFRWLREEAPDGDYRIEVLEGTRWQWFTQARKTNGDVVID